MSDFVIEARNVTKTYELGEVPVHVLKGVDVQIKRGEFVSITGPSGSGKTTLLDVLSGLLRPTRGEILIDGKKISEMDDNALAHVRGKTIGFVFQSFHLINRLTALENVMLPLWFQGISEEERREIAARTLISVGLGDRLHHRPTELSGGQRQRVAIARALATDPDVIVADEPTGNLDSQSGATILNMIDELNKKEGKTILMVTHERYVAERAERIIHIKDGLIQSSEKVRKTKEKAKGDYK
ncbi:MAG: ABC transporter ATP-binding protein [Candidatus Iainarchaeum archaeon]|uniref:ABC transporter ATP-binding protein n=1 Tax=Candidatus Iainarchaeum sp. TaxID=3101447 RepID=A0A7T9DK28_9ARCH|nr:MAG: ABC transporter ATP-binding protein [Candidatus Diapherotrites archaeon]